MLNKYKLAADSLALVGSQSSSRYIGFTPPPQENKPYQLVMRSLHPPTRLRVLRM
jgi:hypothetical protein